MQTESIIPYHDSILHSHKHENREAGSGTAKDMEMLHGPVVEGGLERVQVLDKKKEQHCWISALPPDCSYCVVRS